jgi:hypothetical protein
MKDLFIIVNDHLFSRSANQLKVRFKSVEYLCFLWLHFCQCLIQIKCVAIFSSQPYGQADLTSHLSVKWEEDNQSGSICEIHSSMGPDSVSFMAKQVMSETLEGDIICVVTNALSTFLAAPTDYAQFSVVCRRDIDN